MVLPPFLFFGQIHHNTSQAKQNRCNMQQYTSTTCKCNKRTTKQQPYVSTVIRGFPNPKSNPLEPLLNPFRGKPWNWVSPF